MEEQREYKVHLTAQIASLVASFGISTEQVMQAIEQFSFVVVETTDNLSSMFDEFVLMSEKVVDYFEYESIKSAVQKGWSQVVGFKPKQFNIIRKPFTRARSCL